MAIPHPDLPLVLVKMRMSHCRNFPRKHTPIMSTHHGNGQKTGLYGTCHAPRQRSGPPGTAFTVALLFHMFSSRRLDCSSSPQRGNPFVIMIGNDRWAPCLLPCYERERKQRMQPGVEGRAPAMVLTLPFTLHVARTAYYTSLGLRLFISHGSCENQICKHFDCEVAPSLVSR